ncbi:polymorphic toxin type 24 domain-containing protein [Aliikangiella sp. G2MR2-5]|uniref:polymorphic toxin type 24 domain-containing protein n=1 Tax=Aliikangiella sp. G2MR2-5 TaxID=2788943 RepID=UPI0018A9B426
MSFLSYNPGEFTYDSVLTVADAVSYFPEMLFGWAGYPEGAKRRMDARIDGVLGDMKANGNAALEAAARNDAQAFGKHGGMLLLAVMPKPRVTKREAPSIKEQALELKSLNNNKNSVRIQTQDKKIHYDLDGASHKGVETPHVQTSYPNTNPNTGQTFWNKDNSAAGVKPMTQQDIRTVRKYLEKKDSN